MRPLKNISEKELVKGCLKQKTEYQKELYKRYSSTMMAICRRYSKDIMEAEDMLQNGFIKVFDSLSFFEMKGSLEGWIRRVIVTTSLNDIRKRFEYTNIDEEIDLIDPTIEIETVSEFSEKELIEIISRIPPGYRQVFNMYVIEGYDHAEIAEVLDIGEASSRSQYLRAKKYLRKEIEKIRSKRLAV